MSPVMMIKNVTKMNQLEWVSWYLVLYPAYGKGTKSRAIDPSHTVLLIDWYETMLRTTSQSLSIIAIIF
jgi:hypothetical protein